MRQNTTNFKILKPHFTISSFDFDRNLESKVKEYHSDYLSWPLVYFLKNESTFEGYVGETTDVLTRLKTHGKTTRKQSLTSVNIILSELFNKSATLDIESNLIRYIAADGTYSLQNGNLGIANHNYYKQKEVYWELFKDVWDELRSMGITRHSLEYIDNSDLFKYSPYKSLSKEQVQSLKLILNCLLDDNAQVSLIKGGAGTGKSILAIFLFKLLKTDLNDFNYADFDEEDIELYNLLKEVREKYGDLKMALVVPMASFRKTVANVFKNIKGLSTKMVIGPSELASNKYDLVIVDEGHRLRRRANLGSYFGTFDKNCAVLGLDKMTASELDWVQMQAAKSIVFYDHNQSIKPSDALRESFEVLENLPSTRVETLRTQFRVKGGNEYVDFINALFSNNPSTVSPIECSEYEFYLYNDLQDMVDQIKFKERTDGLSRLVAGYAWEWVSNKNPDAFDIIIGNTHLKWNSVAIDWVNSPNAMNEVGCIHTTQGYDLNYAGVIIGPELDYDFATQRLVVYKDRYKDKNGRNGITEIDDLVAYILNIYKTIFLRGIKGTYFYVCNENLRRYLEQFIPVRGKEEEEKIFKIYDEPGENRIPFYDLRIAAGSFSELQQQETNQFIEVEQGSNLHNYFACQVVGESMNRIIPNGSICLFRKYDGGSRNGLITLVESTHFTDSESGSRYTIKEYLSKKSLREDGWHHEEIHLLPKSHDDSFEPIILTDDELMDFKVLGVFVRVVG